MNNVGSNTWRYTILADGTPIWEYVQMERLNAEEIERRRKSIEEYLTGVLGDIKIEVVEEYVPDRHKDNLAKLVSERVMERCK